jgi:hypothetical protein
MDGQFNFCRMAIKLSPVTKKNAAFLTLEMEWLRQIIDLRLRLYFNENTSNKSITEILPPPVNTDDGPYSAFILVNELTLPQRILLAIAIAPSIKPELLDAFFAKNTTYDKKFSEFGGTSTSTANCFIPTAQTALFLLAGNDLQLRFLYYQLFDPDQFLIKSGVIELNDVHHERSLLNSLLQVHDDYVGYLITGEYKNPAYNESFPAKQLTTGLNWEDVVLSAASREGIEEVRDWLQFGKEISMLKGLQKRLKPGYKTLFYGPPGTGKTLTAALLGKATKHEVYRIDISLIVSRYVGETEKNLAKVFDRAESKDWILFFDEPKKPKVVRSGGVGKSVSVGSGGGGVGKKKSPEPEPKKSTGGSAKGVEPEKTQTQGRKGDRAAEKNKGLKEAREAREAKEAEEKAKSGKGKKAPKKPGRQK